MLTGAASSASTTGTIDLLDSYNLRIEGAGADDRAGALVAAAGDLNEDGLGDVLIGAPGADANARPDSGSVFVVFGAASPASLDLANLGTRGFRIDGAAAGDRLGVGAAGVGDVNGDRGRADDLRARSGFEARDGGHQPARQAHDDRRLRPKRPATAIKVADTAKSGVQVVYHGGKRFIEGAPDFFGI